MQLQGLLTYWLPSDQVTVSLKSITWPNCSHICNNASSRVINGNWSGVARLHAERGQPVSRKHCGHQVKGWLVLLRPRPKHALLLGSWLNPTGSDGVLHLYLHWNLLDMNVWLWQLHPSQSDTTDMNKDSAWCESQLVQVDDVSAKDWTLLDHEASLSSEQMMQTVALK